MTIAQLHQLFSTYKTIDLYGRYITLNHIHPLLEKLNEFFKIDVVGNSVLEKPIYKITCGNGSRKVLMWSQMHGNESTTTKALFDLLNVLAQDKNENVVSILNTCTITILPLLNPDGAEAYTRVNANNIDLNRDAQDRSQPESQILRDVFNSLEPDFCFNLHGQRTIFSAGSLKNTAALSFLAPAQDDGFALSSNRKVAMDLISRIKNSLHIVLPDQIGIYDDSFNLNCVGDTFQSLGVPTVLYEAGHFPGDYQREVTRELIFKSLLLGLDILSTTTDLGEHHKFYFQIPQNQKLFRDIIIRNVLINDEFKDIAVQYKEVLSSSEIIEFSPEIEAIESELKLFGHREIDADFNAIITSSELKVGCEIVFVEINNEKFSLYA